MTIIVGLGNPGRQYVGTRHNIGFDIVDALAKKHGIRIKSLRFRAIIGRGHILGLRVCLMKPLTYMNKSGEAVRRIRDFGRIDEKKELLVVCDDVNLAPGQIRIRAKGSDGGHNGLKSIIAALGHQEFTRMRIGVGAALPGHDMVGHVLGEFSGSDRATISAGIERAVAALECILDEGLDAAMNKFNANKAPLDC